MLLIPSQKEWNKIQCIKAAKQKILPTNLILAALQSGLKHPDLRNHQKWLPVLQSFISQCYHQPWNKTDLAAVYTSWFESKLQNM